jgi:transcriptional regulator with XRE-family HTH domain
MWSDIPEKPLQLALGALLAKHRKNRGLTQPQLAEKAGIGTATLVRLENSGQANVDNFLRVLRALRLLDRLEEAIALPDKSPLELLREQERK